MQDLVYLYHGASEYILRKEINKLLEELNVDQFNVVKYDLLESNFSDVIEELQTISFFSDQRVVLVSGVLELYKLDEYDQQRFIQYLENPNPDTILIMYSSQINEDSLPITKAINLYAKITKLQEIKKEDLDLIIKKSFEEDGYEIASEAISELIERTNGDYPTIEQEITKLKLYACDHKAVNVQAIRLLVSKNFDVNIFELSSAIVAGDKTKAIQIYYDLLVSNISPVRIVSYLSGRIRELIHTGLLLSRGYSQDMIAKHFQVSDAKAYYMVRDAKAVGVKKLEKYLEQLVDLDFDIKSGNIDPRLGVELFLFGVE